MVSIGSFANCIILWALDVCWRKQSILTEVCYSFSLYGWSYIFVLALISLLSLFCWRTHLSRSRRLSSKSSTITGLRPYKYYIRLASIYLLINHVISNDDQGRSGTNTDSHHGDGENNLHRHGYSVFSKKFGIHALKRNHGNTPDFAALCIFGFSILSAQSFPISFNKQRTK